MLIECLFLTLVLSAFLIPSSNVLGESSFSPQMQTEALLAIVTQANDTVVGIYSDLRTRGLPIPPAAVILYDAGLVKAAEAFGLYHAGSYEDASAAAVEALGQFKEALDVVYTEVQDPATQIPSANEIARRLNHSITRSFRYLNYIETLAHTLEAQGYDTTVLENQIQSARGLLHKALRDLRQHRFQSVDDRLIMVKDLQGTLQARLAVIALELKVSRLATFIGAADVRLTRLKGTILSLSSELSPAATNASLAAVQDAEQNLDSARSLLEVQQVDEVVNELVQSKASEEEARRILRENQPTTGSVAASEPASSSLEPMA
jgi:hypothetical protein